MVISEKSINTIEAMAKMEANDGTKGERSVVF
jgi:hypothetical protein